MSQQLHFDLPAKPALGRDDFFVSEANALAVALIEGWQDWASRKLLLTGEAKSGKTHLAHVWAQLSGATVIAARDLAAADIPALAQAPLAIENVDEIAGDETSETALFHAHNLVLAEGHALLLTARTPAVQWGLQLPDLASRMAGTTQASLATPDEALLMAVLAKLFADRQLNPTPETTPYLARHMSRSFATAEAVVAAMDAASLAQNRALNRGLAAEILDKIND